MFSIFVRSKLSANHKRTPPGGLARLRPRPTPEPDDLAGQARLVEESMVRLEEVRAMLESLPDLPVADRGDLMRRLDDTVERLRPLAFLDTVY